MMLLVCGAYSYVDHMLSGAATKLAVPLQNIQRSQDIRLWCGATPQILTHAAANPLPSWTELMTIERPDVADTSCTTLYREREGWHFGSQQLWLALEMKGIDLDCVLVTQGSPAPSTAPAQAPQSLPALRCTDGRLVEGDAMSLVRASDDLFPDSPPLWPPHGVEAAAVTEMVEAMAVALPVGARPCTQQRSQYLFLNDKSALPNPLPRQTFEATLDAVDGLLARHPGPYFCGARPSAADVSWVPVLERYAFQAEPPDRTKDHRHSALTLMVPCSMPAFASCRACTTA
jgi:glutathione S-transferase